MPSEWKEYLRIRIWFLFSSLLFLFLTISFTPFIIDQEVCCYELSLLHPLSVSIFFFLVSSFSLVLLFQLVCSFSFSLHSLTLFLSVYVLRHPFLVILFRPSVSQIVCYSLLFSRSSSFSLFILSLRWSVLLPFLYHSFS